MSSIATTSINQQSKSSTSDALSFIKKHRKNKPFPFMRSSLGSTGLTFISRQIEFKYVLKWQKLYYTQCEHFCTNFYKRAFSHLSIPKVDMISGEKEEKAIRQFFQEESVSKTQHLLCMEFKRGSNLADFVQYGNFFQLPQEGIKSLFTQFGEIAGYDLIIANCDRFLPAGFRGKIQSSYEINAGNIMIEVKNLNLKDIEVHVIDNAPHFVSFFRFDEREKKQSGESNSDIGLSLLGMNSDVSYSSSDDDQIETTSKVNLAEERGKDFDYFIRGDIEVLKLMAEQIITGFNNEFNRMKVDKEKWQSFFERNSQQMRQKLVGGLKKAQLSIKAVNMHEVRTSSQSEELNGEEQPQGLPVSFTPI
ncbi:hypothetical protein [Candidatus Neptunochlamydia vexilliferae]|uniref:Uncharacterized protein n=1 Tax=Candidatus Neptunichlamydia vexilliferae TaxID=1651774 RepID=A0ABS0B1B8_9BACT|nr:hypothetical protein [Candidatus Neptunochlamydia vexilliferae]MBF5059979.1 hypothetical protein [Candidatus Neptunochlamydia vexilliferae]